MRVGIPEGLADFKPLEPLDNGWYTIEIKEAKGIEKPGANSSIMLRYEVLEGQPQQDEANPDPVGREGTCFITLGTQGFNPQFASKIKATMKSLFDATGLDYASGDIDPEEIRGKVIKALNQNRMDKVSGKKTESFIEFAAS